MRRKGLRRRNAIEDIYFCFTVIPGGRFLRFSKSLLYLLSLCSVYLSNCIKKFRVFIVLCVTRISSLVASTRPEQWTHWCENLRAKYFFTWTAWKRFGKFYRLVSRAPHSSKHDSSKHDSTIPKFSRVRTWVFLRAKFKEGVGICGVGVSVLWVIAVRYRPTNHPSPVAKI